MLKYEKWEAVTGLVFFIKKREGNLKTWSDALLFPKRSRRRK